MERGAWRLVGCHGVVSAFNASGNRGVADLPALHLHHRELPYCCAPQAMLQIRVVLYSAEIQKEGEGERDGERKSNQYRMEQIQLLVQSTGIF